MEAERVVVTIRKCTTKDVPAIAKLSQLWRDEACTFAYPGANEVEISQRLGDYFCVAETDGQLFGYTHGVIKTSQYPIFEQNAQFLEIYELYVHPDYRSHGIGNRLMDNIIAEAKSRGISYALVGSSNIDWEHTVGFYQRQGFKMWYVQMYK